MPLSTEKLWRIIGYYSHTKIAAKQKPLSCQLATQCVLSVGVLEKLLIKTSSSSKTYSGAF